MTIEDILESKLKLFEKAFVPAMRNLFNHASKIPNPTMLIIHTGDQESTIDRLVHFLFSDWLRAKGRDLESYDIMPFGEDLETDLDIENISTVCGCILQIKQQIQTANKLRPPTIILGNKKVDCFKNSGEPSYIVNISKR